jgi:hypothetical protein
MGADRAELAKVMTGCSVVVQRRAAPSLSGTRGHSRPSRCGVWRVLLRAGAAGADILTIARVP